MVAIFRNFSTARSSVQYIPRRLSLYAADRDLRRLDGNSFPFFDERKQLESRLVSLLDGCDGLVQLKQVHARVYRKGLEQCCYVLAKLVRTLNELGVPVDSYQRLVFRQVHAQTMLIGGFCSDLYVGNTLIGMYVSCCDLGSGRKVFDEMLHRDVISWTTLIVAYTKTGDMVSAGDLFDGLPVKDMVAWTAMVTGFAQNAKPREALQFFKRMQDAGVETDEVTLAGVISACAQLGVAKYAKWVQDVAEKSGLGPTDNVVVGSAMVDMYSKCGNIEDAYLIFKGMKERNVYTYSSMILGFAIHGLAQAAMQLFNEMVETETKPNKVTFIGVLAACSHVGMVDQGKRVFSLMEKHYGVVPDGDHYACMIDLLGRAGHLNEALKLTETMPVKPHGGVWGALLGACRIHRNPDIAQIAASHLFELEPHAIGNYMVLCNIFASAGRWDDVSDVRKLMRGKGLKKNPGCSWFESKEGEIHEFFAGDTKHPRSSEINGVLEDLLQRLKGLGYQQILSSVAYDVSEDVKKGILMAHSEKLALAFGLLDSSANRPIRIMKNLRICEDCHSFMCGVSHIIGREIIVRDNVRFHHFNGGTCSCGNFW
ncbi:pentatricopeptide repeat-containing protein At5g44230 isoform X2 [Rhodamnia argentea]|uniref:Pentatricopeptide repeat-containing protein At5g44230 isoform X2 n=1 Tax=Rhodamnia argentea TaxID=178133 RepID=A0ABM3HN65_9MYRT|nr:pentatricopeptide repeat-containing protein At5g44230 isoform X2 [Rhodamnia argentea]